MVLVPGLGTLWPMREITYWLAEHVFGVRPPLVFTGNSGDTVFHWVQTAWLLVFAVLVTAAWPMLQPGREHERTWHKWFRVFIRFGLAAQMFYYGMAKIIPTQFPPPSLVTLVESVGNLSLSDLLWTSIGASTPYQIFTGVRGDGRRHPAALPADDDARRADLAGRHDSGFRAEHDLRLRPEADLVPLSADVPVPARARRCGALPTSSC